MKIIQTYLNKRSEKTNIRVMIEICNDYKTYCKVLERTITPQEFNNMNIQQRFTLLYNKIGVNWKKYGVGDLVYDVLTILLIVGLVCITYSVIV